MDLSYLLKQWADRSPDKEALIFKETRLTYKAFNERVNAVCRALMAMGFNKGDRVAILTFNNHQFMEIFFACSRIGALMVPLNFRLVGREMVYQLNDSEPIVLFLGEEFQETIQGIRHSLKSVKEFIVIGEAGSDTDMIDYENWISDHSNQALSLAHSVDLEDEFLIIYTSGTTGNPKGAILTQMNVLFTSLNQIIDFQCTTKDITLTLAPLFHAAGCLIITFSMIHVGGTAVIQKTFDPQQAVGLIEKEKVSVMFAVPAMWTAIMQLPQLLDADLTSLRFCVSGGSSQPVEEMKKFNNTFGVPFTEGYGLSECSSCSCMLMWEYAMEKSGSIGKPFIHNELKVVNLDGNQVKPGEIGEIVQKGLTVMKGYYNKPEQTQNTIIDGWLHTGDLATIDNDGFIKIKGRSKEMIISGAENIYPVEIEKVLVANPKILEAAVIGVPDEKWGETVKAVVVLMEGQKMNEKEVIEYCKENMASYKKPTSVDFIDSLPRNPSGKVVKYKLK